MTRRPGYPGSYREPGTAFYKNGATPPADAGRGHAARDARLATGPPARPMRCAAACAYHGPSDFRLWAPVGDARHTPETPASSARLAGHAAAAAAAPHSVLGREPPRASKTRDGLPRLKRTRATALYINKGFPPFSTHRKHSAHCDPWHLSRASYATACIAPRPRAAAHAAL